MNPSTLLHPALRLLARLLLVLLLPAASSASTEPDLEAYRQHLQTARTALAGGHYQQAVAEFLRANQAHGSDSLVCFHGLSQAQRQMGDYVQALASARRLLELSDNPRTQAAAHNEIGLTLLRRAEGQDVEQAIAAFRQALELSGGADNAVRFNLGQALLRLGQDEEGVATLRAYLAADPQAAAAEQARALIAEPRRAREDLVPDFSFVTLDGQTLNRRELEGKVVLLDFWATWCAPCRQAVPSLRRLERKLAAKGPFVLVGISVDQDPELVRRFAADHKMGWPQYVDTSGQLALSVFQVTTFPTYVLIDARGTILYRQSGWSLQIERQLASLADQALRKVAAKDKPKQN